jgi:hypothetical protein
VSNRRKPPRNPFYDRMAATAGAVAGYTQVHTPGRTVHGTVLEKWVYSISPDGLTMPHCEHADPSGPAVLCTDDPDPKVRCLRCTAAMSAALADDRICHLCGRESDVFREFTVQGTGQLIFTGNACRECFTDIRRGRPSPAESG